MIRLHFLKSALALPFTRFTGEEEEEEEQNCEYVHMVTDLVPCDDYYDASVKGEDRIFKLKFARSAEEKQRAHWCISYQKHWEGTMKR